MEDNRIMSFSTLFLIFIIALFLIALAGIAAYRDRTDKEYACRIFESLDADNKQLIADKYVRNYDQR